MPNVSQVLAVNEGSIKLDENLALSNVLYVPGLTSNLIFVSEIVDEIDCVVVFSEHMCALQDRTSKMLIGAVSVKMESVTFGRSQASRYTR